MSNIPPIANPNPYAAPAIPALLVETQPGFAGLWRQGNVLIMHKGAPLPPICVKSNQKAETFLRRNLQWHPPWIAVTILAGLLVYVVLALIMTKRAAITIGLTNEWASRLYLAFFLLLASSPRCLPVGDDDVKPNVVFDEKSTGKTVGAKVGDLLEFRLQGERAMTGWGGGVPKHVGEKNKPPVLERGATRFEPAAGAKDSAIGTYCFQAKAFEPGTVELHFRYIYPDGNGYELMPRLATQVVREFKVTVKVAR